MGKKRELVAELTKIKRCCEVLIGILEMLTKMLPGIDTEPIKITYMTIKLIISIFSIILWVGKLIHDHREKKKKLEKSDV